MSITIKQFLSKDTRHWLMGENLLFPTAGTVRAWRDLGDPGTAYTFTTKKGDVKSDPCLRHYSTLEPAFDRYMKCTIPSFAFHKATIASGKPCWELTSKLWFRTILSIKTSEREITFKEFANKVISFAKEKEFNIEEFVRQAWKDVGIDV
ncbi:hypothetical protein DM02DRAFT_240881 [Periconia macrospinosa]|uniref:Peptidase M4 C-terminal domain-containing protein n=1 Tax=Periconia macrospinosa TaxID=97972 RepID=A0A2V1E1Y1_9PLEO|nr:hypothetical protein DM02DRAFT_240881 [Periconia macrospinosa]